MRIFLALLSLWSLLPARSFAFLGATRNSRRSGTTVFQSLSSAESYLSLLSSVKPETPAAEEVTTPVGKTLANGLGLEPATTQGEVSFSHAPISYFAVDKLEPKGPRRNADVGEPHDATRPLVKYDTIRAGSWWCEVGGWPSPNQRATTEVFLVFSGQGCVTDMDGTRHPFGPGDTVILPKGWSGRWDIVEPIHKVWFVHDHPTTEETSDPIRALVTPLSAFALQNLTPEGKMPDAVHGSPCTSSRTIYDVGPTKVGCWTCTPGSFPVSKRETTECFHVLEGVFFLTNADGSARRCIAGDTVVLPKGWVGHWDVIEIVKTLWTVVPTL